MSPTAASTPSVIRFHRQVPGLAGIISGTLDVMPGLDGTLVVWLNVAGRNTRFTIAADEPFASAWQRIEAQMQASYPICDMRTGTDV